MTGLLHALLSGNLILVLVVCVAAVWLAGTLVRHQRPDWHWFLVGYPACWFRMRWSWRAFTVQCDLTGDRRGQRVLVGGMSVQGQSLRPVIPSLFIGRPLLDGLQARVRLLPGQTPEQYARHQAAMMHAWRVHRVRVSSAQRGFADIRVWNTDPLSGLVERDPHDPDGWPDGAGEPTDDMPVGGVVGVREDGRAWVIDFRARPHWMVTGATQSGKSTLVHALMSRLMPFPIALVGIDLKGGMELSMYRPRLSGLAISLEGAAALLTALLALLEARAEACRVAAVQSVWRLGRIPPPVVVLVDEVARLFRITGPSQRSERDRAVAALISLAERGAALGIHLLICGQRLGSELGSGLTALRAELGGRICHHVHDEESAVMTLGDLWPDAVVAALLLTEADQGIAVTSDGAGSWVRARGAYTTAQQAAASASRYAAMAPVLPGIERPLQQVGGGAARVRESE